MTELMLGAGTSNPLAASTPDDEPAAGSDSD